MKKIALFFITLIFLSSFASAEVLIIPSLKSINVFEGQTTEVKILIRNFGDEDVLATYNYVNPSPSQLSIAFDRNSPILIPANSDFNLTLYLTALPEAISGTKLLTFELKDLNTGETLDSVNLIIKLQSKTKIYITDLFVNKGLLYPNDQLEITAKVINNDVKSYEDLNLEFQIVYAAQQIKRFEERLSLSAGEQKTITKVMNITNYLRPGEYVVIAKLKDVLGNLLHEKLINFAIAEVPNKVQINKYSRFQIFSIKNYIVLRNEGNVETTTEVRETIKVLAPFLFSPSIKPESFEKVDGQYVALWKITLAPGEEKTIEYDIQLYPQWMAAILLIAGVYFVLTNLTTVSIKKFHTFKGKVSKGKEITIVLEVKNNSIRTVENVEVRDFVPGLFNVIEKYEVLPPKIRKAKDGYHISWKLGKMSPREERVLMYKIKPKVDIEGEFVLPTAQVIFKDWRDRKVIKVSNIVKLKA